MIQGLIDHRVVRSRADFSESRMKASYRKASDRCKDQNKSHRSRVKKTRPYRYSKEGNYIGRRDDMVQAVVRDWMVG